MIIKVFDNQVKSTDSYVPETSHLCYIAAPIGSGKTIVMLNMILSDEIYGHKFNKIIIINPNYRSDKKWNNIIDKELLVPNKLLMLSLIKENFYKELSQCKKGSAATIVKKTLKQLDILWDLDYLPITYSCFHNTLCLDYLKNLCETQQVVSEKYSEVLS